MVCALLCLLHWSCCASLVVENVAHRGNSSFENSSGLQTMKLHQKFESLRQIDTTIRECTPNFLFRC